MLLKTPIVAVALLLCLQLGAGTAAAQPAPSTARHSAAEELRDRGLQDDTAFLLTKEITTKFGPRLAGSKAEAEVARSMAERLRSFGLQNMIVEPFPVTMWRRNAESAAVVGTSAQPLHVAALGGSPATPADGIEGEIVLFESLDALRAATVAQLESRIAMLNYQMPRTQSGLGYVLASAGRSEGPGLAAARGAIAFMMRSAGTDVERAPHAGGTRYEQGRVPIPAFAISIADANQIERLASHEAVRVRLRSSADVIRRQSQNVIAEIMGRTAPEEIVLIGAHLDSWDLGTGALDDAAGVAIVAAAAKLIREMPQRPRRTIRVVLFGAEEQSQPGPPFFLAGAHAYADKHKLEAERHVIASESDFGAGRIFGLQLPDGAADSNLGRQIALTLLPLGILVEPGAPNHAGPDIIPLQGQGVPVFLLKQDASDYFDAHHTERDTLERVDPDALKQNVATWAALVWLIADSDANFRPVKAGR